ncbi:MAG: hypothetical protein IKX00_03500 [Bacilli bacterium]|nr:hypothetical protein [Bacilli bacterium]
MDTYEYSYYLFTNGNENEPKVIGARTLNLPEFLYDKYPNIRKDDYMANSSTYLFNMLYSSNQELLNAVIDRYNEVHPRSKLDKNNYNYIAMMGPGNKTKKYGLLKFKYSDKEKKEDKQKLIPFVFKSDVINICEQCKKAGIDIKAKDFNHPSNLLVKMFSSFWFISKNSKYKDFYNELERKYESLLKLKYMDVIEHATEQEKFYYIADPSMDTRSIEKLLNSGLISNKYKLDSVLYFNILSMVCHDIRLYTMANDQGYTYNPVTRKIGYDDVSANYQGLTAISSIQELRERNIENTNENTEGNSRN